MNSPHDRDEGSSKGDMEALHLSIQLLGLINLAEEDDSLLPPCDLSPGKIMLKLDGPDETQTEDGWVTGGNFSYAADQQTLRNVQGSENSFLRQSLDWNTAFFTEQGLLDPYELAEYTNTALPESPPDHPFPKCKTRVVSCHQVQSYTSSSLQERSGKRPSRQTHGRTHSDFIEKPMKRKSAWPHAGHLIKNQQPESTSQEKTSVNPPNKRTGLHNDIIKKQRQERHISLSSSPAMTRTSQGFNTQHKVCEKSPLHSKKVEPGNRSKGNSNKKVDNLYCKRVASQPSGPMPSPVFNARAGKDPKKLVPNQHTKDSARNVGCFAKTISSVSRCVENKLGQVLAGTKMKNTDDKHPSLVPKDKLKPYALKPSRRRLPSPKIDYFNTANNSFLSNTRNPSDKTSYSAEAKPLAYRETLTSSTKSSAQSEGIPVFHSCRPEMNSPHDKDEDSSKGGMEALQWSIECLGLINVAEEDDSLLPAWVDDFSCDLSTVKIMLKLDGPDETQTKDGWVTVGDCSSAADQQTSGNAQGSENSFLHQSLDWNTAFFTEQGLLDPYELAEYTNTALPESPPDHPFPKCKTRVVSCHQVQSYTSSSLQERSGKRPSRQTHGRTHSDFIEKPMKRKSAWPHAGHLIKNQQPESTSQEKTSVNPPNKRTGLHNDISKKQSQERHISLSSSPAMTRTSQGFNTQHKVCEKPPLHSKKVELENRSKGISKKKVDNLYCKTVASQPSGTKTKNTEDKHPSLIPKDNFALPTAMSGASSSVCQRAPMLQQCDSVNAAYELWPASNMKSGEVSHAPELSWSSFDTFFSQNYPTRSFSPMTSPMRKGHISSERDHLLPLESLRAEIQCAENSGITSGGVDSVGYDPRSFPSSANKATRRSTSSRLGSSTTFRAAGQGNQSTLQTRKGILEQAAESAQNAPVAYANKESHNLYLEQEQRVSCQ